MKIKTSIASAILVFAIPFSVVASPAMGGVTPPELPKNKSQAEVLEPRKNQWIQYNKEFDTLVNKYLERMPVGEKEKFKKEHEELKKKYRPSKEYRGMKNHIHHERKGKGECSDKMGHKEKPRKYDDEKDKGKEKREEK